MKKIVFIALLAAVAFMSVGSARAQANNLITEKSVGKLKLGMTVAEARRILSPLKLSRAEDIYSGPYIAVKQGKKEVLRIDAWEDAGGKRIDNKAKIFSIRVEYPRYRTAAGVRVGMLLAEAQKKYGGMKEISYNEEYLDSVTFINHPQNILFRIKGKSSNDEDAGIYEKNSETTSKYKKGTMIASIEISNEGQDLNEDMETSRPEDDYLNKADRIVYKFGDRSVAPDYHRSYTITVTGSKARLVVDSYGKIITTAEVVVTSNDLAQILAAFRTGRIGKQKAVGEKGCTGGVSEEIIIYRGKEVLFDAGVYRCGGMDQGELSGDVAVVKSKMSSLFTNFEKLILTGVPSN